jgi:hypothetical protein
MGAIKHLFIMPANLDKQCAAMNSLAWRVTYAWNCAKNRCLTMNEMQAVWRESIAQSADYQCLANKRKSTICFLWHHTRNRILAENQLYGYWYKGSFYSMWSDLPESVRYDEQLTRALPQGHFWLDGNKQATAIRYFISADSASEDRTHFLAPFEPVLPNVTKC